MVRATIVDIAQKSGVSLATVSRVLNGNPKVGDAIRQRVERAAQELGYTPNSAASRLRGGKAYALALLVGPLKTVMDGEASGRMPSYITDVIAGLLRACRPANYHLVIEAIRPGDPCAAIEEMLARISVDGVVLLPPLCDDMHLLEALDQRGLRTLRLNAGTFPPGTATVGVDNAAAGRDIAAYLLGLGHRRIGYIAGPHAHGSHGLRAEGFIARLGEEPEVELVTHQGNFLFDSGEREGGALLDRSNPPTAIFAANDEMAAGVIAAASERRIAIPGDLSIIGYGDLAVAQNCSPRLTTFRQPTSEMAALAAGQLIERGPQAERAPGSPPEIFNLPYHLVERSTAGPVPVKT
ncbi:LacI family DNA-binding transcriptional regulator [Altericroceibacterium xinjiangense]|uniref:LacI family DNA-binding transcriptional regulator n=1 Tax=Altericroceibacterium xinjiangense TaxID=762261 RepID=UPI000F7DD8AD|nr:LacI family DNA-binding transcriptional regulator [Altericroceibacterium xinjiangense]